MHCNWSGLPLYLDSLIVCFERFCQWFEDPAVLDRVNHGHVGSMHIPQEYVLHCRAAGLVSFGKDDFVDRTA